MISISYNSFNSCTQFSLAKSSLGPFFNIWSFHHKGLFKKLGKDLISIVRLKMMF